MKIVTIILTFLISFNIFGQKFINQIQVGEKMPSEIKIGGFIEQNSSDCECRTFSIDYGYDIYDPATIRLLQREKGAKLGSVIALHYNSKNIITGKIVIDMYYNEDYVPVFLKQDYEYDLKLINQFEDFEFIENNFETDLYYYSYLMKNYEVDGLTVIRTKGVVKNYRIEETYIPNSSYEPRYKLKNTSSEPTQIAESFGDLDKDGIAEKVVIIDTGIELNAGTERQLLIYKKLNNEWKLWHTSVGVIVQGGLMNSSFENLSIERGCIVIRHFGGSRSKWFYTHRFRYQNNDWELIGATIDNYTMCELSEKFDYNFSTGKMIYTKETETCEEGEDAKVINTENIEFKKKLAELPKMDGFKVGENLIMFTNSEKQFYY
ncbi:hypothetical protein DFQ02_1331 [Seonamhaeicola aphaedonensis]|uniref:Uncharacterized protein n=2 Tax=Seonamhaeicola aphaedonensis TaxID=1461338 RepID=A0A3D9H2J7_9FLAO|nr:hypothetical protein DFQ02_1331 [Seonamhaeicola aphaedonensis]